MTMTFSNSTDRTTISTESSNQNSKFPFHSSLISNLFSILDANHTGYLETTTITRRLDDLALSNDARVAPLGSSLMYARELVKLCDKSHDGRISLIEFKAFVQSKELELWDLFCKVDIGKDSLIHFHDLKSAALDAGISISEHEINQFIKTIDLNGDGIIDFEDWRDFLLLLPHEPTLKNVFMFYNTLNTLELDTNTDVLPIPLLDSSANTKRSKYLLAGGIAGAISRSVTAPLDRIRIILQTHTPEARTTTSKKASNIYIQTIIKIYKDGGMIGFFRGNGLNTIKVFPESALKFFIFESSKTAIATFNNSDKDSIGVQGRFAAGGLAGLLSQFFIYPLETIKTRMMTQIPNQIGNQAVEKTRIFTIIKTMYSEGKIKSFYRGIGPSLLGIVPYAGIDLALFETFRVSYMQRWGNSSSDRPPMTAILVFGMVSGGISASLLYPLSIIRTRLQAQGTPSHPQRYTSAMDVVQKTFKNEGLKGFYKGLFPTLLKVLPAVSISYMAYEKSKWALGIE